MQAFGLTKMQLLKIVLLVSVFVLSSVRATARKEPDKVVSRDGPNRGESYVNFVEEKFSYLNITALGGDFVDKMPECSFACLDIPSCFSFNLGTTPEANDRFRCELLPSDKYNHSNKFVHSLIFHHFSIATPCRSWPCQNNGKCLPVYEENDYKCICEGFRGKDCENDIDECSSAANECHQNASCQNTKGSYNCTCKDGFEGDGKNCSRANSVTHQSEYLANTSDSVKAKGKPQVQVHYSNCVQLRDAGITNTGQHILLDKNKPLPSYCDQDYMGGGWLMVFKVVVNNAYDFLKVWSSNNGHSLSKSEVINVDGSVQFIYKSRRVIYWGSSIKPKEARLALYDNQTLVLSLVFNATDSNNTSWFSKNRLIQSPWTEDLQNQQQNFFSLLGDLTARRAFFINKVYNNSCSGDNGWLMASSGKSCSYERRFPQRKAFLYSKLNTSVNWKEHENVGSADVLAVFIR
ncbi:PREDICTED: uncharacterized protein LOC107348546 isoform X2 [Acropora digitifera]|uniref:uncharacterized protein LOC107348546 isoform X1 n=1 Tax=Acropora digitifera TaxID=70779 RepID=UPI00077A1D34|nr:PREDICTED: uncharacterized protein LOC107348546 isoform X1 [Acropora digitifera]XP_015770085.1 PREDICTED: uncharacterized protein LOC107348546 isoform X2 [Acropora digitifera]